MSLLRSKIFRTILVPLFLGMAAEILAVESVNAPNVLPQVLTGLGFEQHLDQPLDKKLVFNDEAGKPITTGSLVGKRPLALVMVYFGCPNICTVTMNGFFNSLKDMSLRLGKDFDVAFVSIDPTENSKLASEKKANYLKKYLLLPQAPFIHFLTGNAPEIKALTDSIGFKYRYEEKTKQYAHPSGVVIFTPDGKISRYLFGVDFPPKDLRFALVEASAYKIGTPLDKFLLFCYHYDPVMGGYGFYIMNILRGLGILTVFALTAFVYRLSRKEPSGRNRNKTTRQVVTT